MPAAIFWQQQTRNRLLSPFYAYLRVDYTGGMCRIPCMHTTRTFGGIQCKCMECTYTAPIVYRGECVARVTIRSTPLHHQSCRATFVTRVTTPKKAKTHSIFHFFFFWHFSFSWFLILSLRYRANYSYTRNAESNHAKI